MPAWVAAEQPPLRIARLILLPPAGRGPRPTPPPVIIVAALPMHSIQGPQTGGGKGALKHLGVFPALAKHTPVGQPAEFIRQAPPSLPHQHRAQPVGLRRPSRQSFGYYVPIGGLQVPGHDAGVRRHQGLAHSRLKCPFHRPYAPPGAAIKQRTPWSQVYALSLSITDIATHQSALGAQTL